MKNARRNVWPTPQAGATKVRQRKWSTMDHERFHNIGRAVCTRCKAILDDKRWQIDEVRRLMFVSGAEPAESVICPACRMQDEQLFEGSVTVHAAWDKAQVEQATQMLRHEEAREKQKNPLQRIVSVDLLDDGIEVTTTTEFLARHLARALTKSFHGKQVVHQSPGEKFVEIKVDCVQGSV